VGTQRALAAAGPGRPREKDDVNTEVIRVNDEGAVTTGRQGWYLTSDGEVRRNLGGPDGADARVNLDDVPARVRVALSAIADAAIHQFENPGTPVAGDWDERAWLLTRTETLVGPAAEALGDDAWAIYRDALRAAVRSHLRRIGRSAATQGVDEIDG
jgi:hypothetical protein